MADIVRLALFLALIAGISGVGLSYVNGLTNPLIEKQMLKEKNESMREVYPDGDKVVEESATYLAANTDPVLKELSVAYKADKPAGVLYLVQTKGYSGPISLLIGFDIATQKITAIKVLSQTETPGLGAKAKDAAFQNRYKNKMAAIALEVTKTPPVKENQIQAITASTITTRAVTVGVNRAREHYLATFGTKK
jgi:Na+-translocating ferredoxin:NAD+ oxidoreductase subunit G